MTLRLVHVELRDANSFVDLLHRHHKKVVGHKFSLGAVDPYLCECGANNCQLKIGGYGHAAGDGRKGKLVGVAIVGRPVSRMRDDGETLEVSRLCTDGTRNACSFLYGACARAAFALGYTKIGTYTLATEDGASLRASGWKLLGERGGGSWAWAGDPKRKSSGTTKLLWEIGENR